MNTIADQNTINLNNTSDSSVSGNSFPVNEELENTPEIINTADVEDLEKLAEESTVDPVTKTSTKKGKTPDFIFAELKTLADTLENTENLPDGLKERGQQMLNRLNRMATTGAYGSEFDTIARYIEVISTIPWGKYSQDNLDLANMRAELEAGHYGMLGVKELIIEFMATMSLLKQRGSTEAVRAPVLLLVGLQGVGKTTLAISLAKAMGRQYVRIAMGAIGSIVEIRGKSKALPGATPGQLIKGVINAGTMNPLILLDEIEKASGNEAIRADIMAALLEILDPNQNHAFRDHYLDYPIDLSKAMFICTANNLGTLSAALLDRMNIVKMPSYTDQEKITIAQKYLFPKIKKNNGLEPDELQVQDDLWLQVVRPFGFDSGIRSLGRILEAMSRKVAKEIVEGKVDKVVVTPDNLKHYMPDTSIR